ncbi:Pex14_N domain-containing protein [Meloidogyne graminicola]|uniref:Peroxisomal membrane protein PEX14 n=1 Tax=Meloidogyne graminicola TaxID=189291 RepID=A0A8S9ZM22_9BILA|nr:Pex14_N domain-containing protein [Meloidogyne graminicola]
MNNDNIKTLKEETSNNSTKHREDLINAAKQFINNPRVRNTPINEQKAFLLKKGLTENEINEAMKERNEQRQIILLPGQKTSQNFNKNSLPILEWAKAIILVGSTSFIIYRFVRSWLLPKMFGLPNPKEERIAKIEEQIISITETNKAIVESFSHQIQISLLLSHNQFPPIPEHSLRAPPMLFPQQNGLNNIKKLTGNKNEIFENGGENLNINEDAQDDEEYQDLDKSNGSQELLKQFK